MTAINDTGQHDAQKANDAVECFVRYLRSTVDVRQNDKLILFEQELAHLHDDVALFCRWCRRIGGRRDRVLGRVKPLMQRKL